MTDDTSAGQTLGERITAALTREHYRRAEARIVASPEEHSAGMADAVLAVVQPEIDRLSKAHGPIDLLDEPCGTTEPESGQLTCTLPARHDIHYAEGSGTIWRILPDEPDRALQRAERAELRRLRTLIDEAERSLPIEQHRLLAISRMVFDGIAEGRPITREEAADLGQRIVDEIGHSITDEPALGPSFRVELAELRATIERLKKLAIMGGQNPITIRQWIIAELFPQYPPAKPVPDLTDLPAAPREPRR